MHIENKIFCKEERSSFNGEFKQAGGVRPGMSVDKRDNKDINYLLASIIHNLKTPLNGILGYTHILKKDSELSLYHKDALTIIESCSHQLEETINDIHEITQLESDKIELKDKVFNLINTLESVVTTHQIYAKENGILLTFELLSELPENVVGDEKRIRQIISNLLQNAIKSKYSGMITFKSGYKDNRFISELHCVTADEFLLSRFITIFEKNNQSDIQYDSAELNLIITKKLIELTGGEVVIVKEPGEIAYLRLTLELPADKEKNVGDIGSIIGISTPKDILIVDDDRTSNIILDKILSQVGFSVKWADNGQEGVRMGKELPDLIILDLNLMDMDGFGVIKQLKNHEKAKDIPVILTSATYMSDEFLALTKEKGADAFLPKPFEKMTLLNLLKDHLDIKWIYGSSGNLMEENEPGEASIPRETLTQFYEAAIIGDIDRLKSIVSEVEVEIRGSSKLMERILRFINGFKMEELIALLERAVGECE